ncbi:MAG: hypothetical protein ACH346_00335 [Chthoniobacterales bacterium]
MPYNNDSFEVEVPSKMLTLVAVSSPTSTSNVNSYIGNVSSVVGFIGLMAFGHELMLKAGDPTVTVPDDLTSQNAPQRTSLTLQHFREAAEGTPTERLVLNGNNTAIHSAADANRMLGDNDDREIIQALQAVLEQEYPSHATEIGNLIHSYFPQETDFPSAATSELRLSTTKLEQILAAVDKSTAATTEIAQPSELDDGMAALSITRDTKKKESEIQRHAFLKDLKKGQEIVVPDIIHLLESNQPSSHPYNIHVTWKEIEQLFSVEAINATPEEKVLLIAQRFNDLERTDREARRADRYSIEDQDQASLLRSLLSHLGNKYKHDIKIVQHSGENILSPSTGNEPICNNPILLYGFDGKSGSVGPRDEIKNKLGGVFKLNNVVTMNDYNDCLNIGAHLNFTKYCEFTNKLKNNSPGNLISPERVKEINARNKTNLSHDNIHLWADFLGSETYKYHFNFFNKLGSPEQKKRFIAKNYYGITRLHNISDPLKQFFLNKNWNRIIEILSPALDLLADAGTQLATDQLFDANALKTRYKSLTKDQKIVLDSILVRSFFRVTSKLGLSFARDNNIPVLFVWKLPEEWGLSPEKFYNYWEIKPYKAEPPQFREIGRDYYPEAITSSEMRQLGRLKQKEEAPNYLLTTKIEPIVESATSEAVEETKNENK